MDYGHRLFDCGTFGIRKSFYKQCLLLCLVYVPMSKVNACTTTNIITLSPQLGYTWFVA